MKKTVALLLLCAVVIFSLCACTPQSGKKLSSLCTDTLCHEDGALPDKVNVIVNTPEVSAEIYDLADSDFIGKICGEIDSVTVGRQVSPDSFDAEYTVELFSLDKKETLSFSQKYVSVTSGSQTCFYKLKNSGEIFSVLGEEACRNEAARTDYDNIIDAQGVKIALTDNGYRDEDGSYFIGIDVINGRDSLVAVRLTEISVDSNKKNDSDIFAVQGTSEIGFSVPVSLKGEEKAKTLSFKVAVSTDMQEPFSPFIFSEKCTLDLTR